MSRVYKTNLNVLSAWKDGGAVGDGGGVWHTGCTCKYSVFITTSLPYEVELSTTLMAMSSLNASSFLFHNDWRLLCTAARYWKLIIMMTLCYQYMKITWSYISLVDNKFAYRILLHWLLRYCQEITEIVLRYCWNIAKILLGYCV